MGLRSVILGHAYPSVLEAVRRQLPSGSNFVRPHPIEVEAAELLRKLVPSSEMVKFAKNGSDATSAAVRLARAFTGRDIIVRCQEHPFFSVNDWFIGDTEMNAGVPSAIQQLTKRFSYNNLGSLQEALERHKGQVACVILEPVTTDAPAKGFLEGVRNLCDEHGAVLIFDETISGFRWHKGGAQTYFGIKPDLSTFGKGIANGFSVSALTGRNEIMERGGLRHPHERVFLMSTTHGGETHALAAAVATLDEFRKKRVTEHLWRIGKQLQVSVSKRIEETGLAEAVKVLGYPCSPAIAFQAANGIPALELRTLFLQETIQRNVLMPYLAPSFSHSPGSVEETLDAAEPALAFVKKAVDASSTKGLLRGAATKPVFRKRN